MIKTRSYKFLSIIIMISTLLCQSTAQSTLVEYIDLCRHDVELSSEKIIETKFESCIDSKVTVENLNCIYSYCREDNFDVLITSLKKYQQEINDFEVVELLDAFCNLNIKNENVKNVFKMFVLEQLGYEAIVYYNSIKTFLLLMTNEDISSLKLKVADLDYSCLDSKLPSRRLDIFDPIKKSVNSKPLAYVPQKKHEGIEVQRSIFFEYLGDELSLSYRINEFSSCSVKVLPRFNLGETYLRQDPNLNDLVRALNDKLKELKLHKRKEVSLFLLNFVQSGISYVYEQEDEIMFPIQTILSGSGDCEDKSLLYAYLINEILGIPTVLFVYENHVNVGIFIEDEIKEDNYSYHYDGKRFLVCEPSGVVTGNFIHEFEFEPNADFKVIQLD